MDKKVKKQYAVGVVEYKPPPKKTKDEIDAIFNKPTKTKKAKSIPLTKPALKPQPKTKVSGNKNDLFGDGPVKNRKKTEEGFTTYTEDELGMTKKNAGMTDKCPFDCDCCY